MQVLGGELREIVRIGRQIQDVLQRRGVEEMVRWNRRVEGGGGTVKAQRNVLKYLGEFVGFVEVYRVNLGVMGEVQLGVVFYRCVFWFISVRVGKVF